MRTLSEIYQATRAKSIALEQALAEAQLQASEAQLQASEAQRKIVKNFITRKFGNELLTEEIASRIEQLSSEQLDELLFQSASWNSLTQLQNYFSI
jgi:hypothetical protein